MDRVQQYGDDRFRLRDNTINMYVEPFQAAAYRSDKQGTESPRLSASKLPHQDLGVPSGMNFLSPDNKGAEEKPGSPCALHGHVAISPPS